LNYSSERDRDKKSKSETEGSKREREREREREKKEGNTVVCRIMKNGTARYILMQILYVF